LAGRGELWKKKALALAGTCSGPAVREFHCRRYEEKRSGLLPIETLRRGKV